MIITDWFNDFYRKLCKYVYESGHHNAGVQYQQIAWNDSITCTMVYITVDEHTLRIAAWQEYARLPVRLVIHEHGLSIEPVEEAGK